uniref:beta-carotene 3-hydroxylase n=1 Tax=Aegilops tauschii subsp. strangulata TaxID=200361 RepID=A0A453J1G9_AEGTS
GLVPARPGQEAPEDAATAPARGAVSERAARKESERRTYLVAALMSSLGITSMAAAAVYYRFAWQMEGGEIPVTEMLGTLALSVGAAVSACLHVTHGAPTHTPVQQQRTEFVVSTCISVENKPYGVRRWGWSSGRGGRTGRCGTRRCGTCTSRTTSPATGPSSSTTCSPSSTPSRPWPSSPSASSTAASSPASASAPVSGSRCSGWPTCSSTTAWSTAASPWAPSRTCPTSGESPPRTRSALLHPTEPNCIRVSVLSSDPL